MMKPNPLWAAFLGAVLLSGADDAAAQLFGKRDLGQPLSRQPKPSSSQKRTGARSLGDTLLENAGTVSEGARYLRGNRGATDFVGTDSQESRGFVGASQATEISGQRPITSAIDDLQIEMGPDVNQTAQPAMPTRIGMYRPRLHVSFDFTPRATSDISTKLADRLGVALRLVDSSLIEVLVEGDAAILRGKVPSERDRRMAGLLVRFEPGIADVRNELEVTRQAAAKPGLLPESLQLDPP